METIVISDPDEASVFIMDPDKIAESNLPRLSAVATPELWARLRTTAETRPVGALLDAWELLDQAARTYRELTNRDWEGFLKRSDLDSLYGSILASVIGRLHSMRDAVAHGNVDDLVPGEAISFIQIAETAVEALERYTADDLGTSADEKSAAVP